MELKEITQEIKNNTLKLGLAGGSTIKKEFLSIILDLNNSESVQIFKDENGEILIKVADEQVYIEEKIPANKNNCISQIIAETFNRIRRCK